MTSPTAEILDELDLPDDEIDDELREAVRAAFNRVVGRIARKTLIPVGALAVVALVALVGTSSGDGGRESASTVPATVGGALPAANEGAAQSPVAADPIPTIGDVPDLSAPPAAFDTSSSSVPSSDRANPEDVTATAPAASAADQPLTVAASGYTSATGGTPAEQEPADGGLPVQSASGQDVRRSFVRLEGSGSVLQLHAAATSVPSASAPEVAACPVSESWEPSRGGTLESGPEFSVENCAIGVAGVDGSWAFDLSSTGVSPDRPEGFALVPNPGATGTFEIVFSGQAA